MITFRLCEKDYWQMIRYVKLHTPRLLVKALLIWLLPPVVLIAVGWLFNWDAWDIFFNVGIGCFLWIMTTHPWRLSKYLRVSHADGEELSQYPHTAEITPRGLHDTCDGKDHLYAWEDFLKLMENRNYLYFFLDPDFCYIIPKREFASKEEAETFMRLAMEYWKEAKGA